MMEQASFRTERQQESLSFSLICGVPLASKLKLIKPQAFVAGRSELSTQKQ